MTPDEYLALAKDERRMDWLNDNWTELDNLFLAIQVHNDKSLRELIDEKMLRQYEDSRWRSQADG